ncbi:NCS2 family permease [Oceanimonas baumannii]|uniref:AGZA family xanthine/uracil permease-like MFS transporter n=1 Tax=Oceanimonas baumannii TaxID=129578 RepID=A0A235CP19_9GAMM|nr:NCS2 family permease [Oceanimonas baumannii]OYD25605.1 guanine permease [Oceanimonas baumannii]TDW61183.1 AGZA family xanthine/uracil permease-like MFS transporter [Oceanimonas baumannii]
MEHAKHEPTPQSLPASGGLLDKLFKLSAHGTTVKTELVAGLTTFVTMAYIIFVNPNIMSASGMDAGAVFVATCIGAAIATLFMGLYANWPVGLAPGMGLNAFFAFTVVGEMGYSWEVALGAVFWSGIIFTAMSFWKIREWVLDAIPESLRYAMTAGVGLFLGFIGLKTAGIVADSPATLLTTGDLTQPSAWLAITCFLIIAILAHRRVFGAVLLGVLITTLIGLAMGIVEYNGIFAAPPSLAPTLFKLDIMGALDVGMITVILAFLFVNMFDTAGTLMGVAERAHLRRPDGTIEGLKKSLKADSASSVIGTFVGCPPVTSYVESSAGVAAGGRTGLTAVTIAVLFLLSIFLAPLAGMVPAYATAGALIYVAFLMTSSLANIDWHDYTEMAPAAITALMMPLTFSIANGIAMGFITYAVLKVTTGQAAKVSAGVYVLSAIFVAKFIFM